MPVITCQKCKGYYRLKEGESLEDFQSCACGGKLEYSEFDYDFLFEKEPSVNFSDIVSRIKMPVEKVNFSKLRPTTSINIPELSLNVPQFPEINLSKNPIHLPRISFKTQRFNEYLYYLIILVVSLVTIEFILYVPDFLNYLMNNEAWIAGALAVLLFFSYVYNESSKNNKFLNSISKISILFIAPLLIAFTSIMLNFLLNI